MSYYVYAPDAGKLSMSDVLRRQAGRFGVHDPVCRLLDGGQENIAKAVVEAAEAIHEANEWNTLKWVVLTAITAFVAGALMF